MYGMFIDTDTFLNSDHLFLSLSILSTVFGQIFYKLFVISNYTKKTYIISSVCFFVLIPCINYWALRGIGVDTFAMYSSITIILMNIFSFISLKEKILGQQLLGIFFIVFGLWIYSY